MTTKYDRIYGCLLAAAIGDAMGSPTETRPVPLVKEHIGKGDFVYDYAQQLPNNIGYDLHRAAVTDDFSCAYLAAKYFLKDGGRVSEQAAIDALIDWKNGEDTHIFFDRYGGPTTRRSIARLEGHPVPDKGESFVCDNLKATNGAGMKAWIIGLFHPGDVDRTIDDAIVMCLPTHQNVIALSGGCAVAAAVAKAMVKECTVQDVIEAGVYGAREGYRRGLIVGRPSAGASIEKRIGLAVELGIKYANDFEKCIVEMTDLIGTGLNANESVPSAFGYFAAGAGDVMKTVYLAVNSGNDSDTTAIMAASMAGAYAGGIGIDSYHLKTLSAANRFMDIPWMAKRIDEVTD